MQSSKIIKKLLRNSNDYGLKVTLQKSMAYIVKPFYENITYRVYAIDLRSIQPVTFKKSEFKFKVVDCQDKDIIVQIEDMEEWLQGRMSLMIRNQSFCMAALDDGKVAGFNLISFRTGCLPLIGFRKRLKKGQAWSDQITVHKDYRGKGLATKLRYRVFEELKNRGVEKIYGGAQISNTASLKLARKVGFRELADIQYVKVLSKEKYYCKRVRA